MPRAATTKRVTKPKRAKAPAAETEVHEKPVDIEDSEPTAAIAPESPAEDLDLRKVEIPAPSNTEREEHDAQQEPPAAQEPPRAQHVDSSEAPYSNAQPSAEIVTDSGVRVQQPRQEP